MLVSWMFKVKTSPFPSSSCVVFEFLIESDFRIFCCVDSDLFCSVFFKVVFCFHAGFEPLETMKWFNDSQERLWLPSAATPEEASSTTQTSPAAFKLQASFTSCFLLIVLTCVSRPHLGLVISLSPPLCCVVSVTLFGPQRVARHLSHVSRPIFLYLKTSTMSNT